MFELARYPVRATWGSHREEFRLSAWDPKIHELFPSLGTLSVRDPVIPSVVHSHAFGPLYGIELSNSLFDPRDETIIVGNRRSWEFGEPNAKLRPSNVISRLRSPRTVAGAWTPMRNSSFAHWILEDLPSALLSFSELNADGVLVPGDATGWQLSILNQVGLPSVRVHRLIRADRLVFIDKQTDYGWPRRDLTDLVVDRVKSGLKSHDEPELELFVSNSGGKRANRLTEVLEDRARAMNYVVIRPEEHPWLDQAGLFASATRVVAPHGGALANLIFCKPGTKVTELMSKRYANPYFEVLSTIRGLNYERRWMPRSEEFVAMNEVLS